MKRSHVIAHELFDPSVTSPGSVILANEIIIVVMVNYIRYMARDVKNANVINVDFEQKCKG